MRPIVEICCGSAQDALLAFEGGADRVELNCALEAGGLTPTLGSLLEIKSHFSKGKVMAMVRPREGDFLYSEAEYKNACRDGEMLLLSGADGLVFGFIDRDGRIDRQRTAHFVRLAHNAGREAVFHRAIDTVEDWKAGLDTLMELGVDRVLTSGQRSTAIEGADTLREMVAYAGGRLEILPGSGVRLHNMEALLGKTGCKHVHMSAHTQRQGMASKTEVSFGTYRQVDKALVAAIVQKAGSLDV